MQQSCIRLYDELAAVEVLAKQVHELRKKVEQLESQVSAKLKVS